MQLSEFVKNYYLHDSFFEKIKYDEKEHVVVMLINFAFWMQSDYQSDDPETGIIKVVFHEVTGFTCSSEIDINAVSILETYLNDDTINFLLMNDMTDDSLNIYITASYVEVCSV